MRTVLKQKWDGKDVEIWVDGRFQLHIKFDDGTEHVLSSGNLDGLKSLLDEEMRNWIPGVGICC